MCLPPGWEARETATRLCGLCRPLQGGTNLPWETVSFSTGCIISKERRFLLHFITGLMKNKAQRQLCATDAPARRAKRQQHPLTIPTGRQEPRWSLRPFQR